ncbi:MAG: ribonuclease HI [Gammaproteobacteria bacterium]|nr:ribonuclease HI [Gammaproteobacteria bacterium]
MTDVEIYTDGACRGNPGPGGWGVLLRSGGRERQIWGGERLTTNNRMEMMAAIQGLTALRRPCRVAVYTDSEYLRRGISEWLPQWKSRGWKTSARKPVKNDDLWRQLDDLATRHEIEWHWVKGHAGHPWNERADALANQGVDAVLTMPDGDTVCLSETTG